MQVHTHTHNYAKRPHSARMDQPYVNMFNVTNTKVTKSEVPPTRPTASFQNVWYH